MTELALSEQIARAAREQPMRLVRLGTILWLTTIVMVVAAIPLTVENVTHIGNLAIPEDTFAAIMALVNSSVGFLIVRFQPRLTIGWLFMALAVPFAVSNLGQSYAIYGLIAEPLSGLPGLGLAAWLQQWLQILAFPIPFALLFMLFPNGRLPSKKWRWLVGVALAILMIQVLLVMLRPGFVIINIADQELVLPVRNPSGTWALAFLMPALDLTWFMGVFMILAGAASVLVRYRTAGWAERQQLKWLLYMLILFLILIPVLFLGLGGGAILEGIVLTLMVLMLPAGTAIAILRYNLYGIDVIIRRTVQYALLTGILAGVYFSSILFLQSVFSNFSNQNSQFILVISTLTIAALFNPLRLRILAFIDRRYFRSRYDAEQVLNRFALTAQAEVDLDHLGAAMIGTIQETVQPERISLWVIDWPEKGAESRSSR